MMRPRSTTHYQQDEPPAFPTTARGLPRPKGSCTVPTVTLLRPDNRRCPQQLIDQHSLTSVVVARQIMSLEKAEDATEERMLLEQQEMVEQLQRIRQRSAILAMQGSPATAG